MWYRVTMYFLLLMAKHFNSKDEMPNEARAQYHNNEFEKRRIDKFPEEYQPEQAFLWSTWDSFIYKLINRALHTQDIDTIFKFRFFIIDIKDINEDTTAFASIENDACNSYEWS